MKLKSKLTIIVILGAICLLAGPTSAKRYMEYLDRGMTVLNLGSGKVYVGWRMFGTDPCDIGFNIYRNSVKLNSSPVMTSTNWLDTGVNLSQANTYLIRPVIDGQEQPQDTAFTLPAYAPLAYDTPDPYGFNPAKHLAIPFADSIDKVAVGDLNGDGKYDYIIKHPQGVFDPGKKVTPHTETFKIAAYNSDGTFMWEVDLWWNIVLGIWWSPVIVYDLNSDGKAEVVAKTAPTDVDYRNEDGRVLTGPEWFTVFDGETGEELAREDWIPRGNISDWGDSYGNRVNRNMMAVAYLDGVRPSLIIFRGIYEKMVAQAWNFNQDNTLEFLWEWNRANDAGGGFHSIHVGDIDGDGKDEILNGSIAIDDDGTTMWDTQEGHGDRFYLSDIDPDLAGLEVFYIQEAPGVYENPLHLTDAATGALIWGYGDDSYGDVGRGLVGDIDPTHRGMECWSANTAAGLLSSEGVRINERPSYANTFVCDRSVWWDDDLLRELTQEGRLLKFNYNLTDGSCQRIGTCGGEVMLTGDVIGDWREEIISLHNGEFRVYTPMTVTPHRFYTFMHDPIYRIDVSSSSVGYPQSAYTSFYMGDGMAPPPQPQIKLAGHWIYGDFTGDNIVNNEDLPYLLELWLVDDCNETAELDLNGDCIINSYEFSVLAENWLEGTE